MNDAALARRYLAGMTLTELGTRTGRHRSNVRRRLIAAGVKFRRCGRRILPMTIRIPRDPAVLAYVAGLFDGEGNLHWRRRTGRTNSARISIYNTYIPVMVWLTQKIGGTRRLHDSPGRLRRGWKPLETWEVTRARDCIALLDALLPYLRIKRAAARAVLRDLRRYV